LIVSPPVSSSAPVRRGAPRVRVPLVGEVSRDLLLGAGLAVLLTVLAFTTGSGVIAGNTVGSGSDLGANTTVEIILTLLGAGAVVAVLLTGARGPAWGAAALLAFTAFAALTALSITWSVQPDASWTASNQTVAYLAVFAVGLALARVVPGRWPALVGAVAVLAVAVCGFALLGKVFLGFLNSDPTLGRLTAPLGYWNAIGLLAAMGLAPLLWAGVGEHRPALVRALTVPGIAILGAALVLCYSRSALIAGIICLAIWFALVPRRLAAAALLVPGGVGAAVISVWVLGHHALSSNNVPDAAQRSAGHTFGWVLLLVLILSTLAGVAVVRTSSRWQPAEALRRRIGIALLALAALIPLGGLAKLIDSSRGLTGEISHLWTKLTSTKVSIGTGSNRLTTVANSRPRYWHNAMTIFSHHVLGGSGALSFGTAQGPYVHNPPPGQNAHSFFFETLSDLGLIGVAVVLVLLVTWIMATRRTLGPLRAAPQAAASPERAGMLTLAVMVLAFGIQSAIDWTWYVPAVAVPALLGAGWLAGRGPLTQAIGQRAARRGLLSHPLIPLTVTVTTVVALALAWAIWQPLRSVQSDNAAVAARAGSSAAIADARAAVAEDPLSINAMSDLASIYEGAGNLSAARSELVEETHTQPENFLSWLGLGSFDLAQHRYGIAQKELRLSLDFNMSDVPTSNAYYQAHVGYLAQIAKRQRAAAARAKRRAPAHHNHGSKR
jgi:O-Antigen ligase